MQEGERAPRDETDCMVAGEGYDCAAALVEIALWQPCRFLFQGAETEAGDAGVRGYELAVLQQEIARSSDDGGRRVGRQVNERVTWLGGRGGPGKLGGLVDWCWHSWL